MNCAHCGYRFDGHETLDGFTKPSNGDILFCIGCGQVNEYKDGIAVKTEFEKLNDINKLEIRALSKAWLKLKEQKKVNFR